ncbi:MAG: hypothetical protein GF384_06510 [Elusimicrobia bacterium]|nr:hypothetical protein [Elusimicrobiota bacterium]MBD3412368.1 hypothetical protein [Elusimicrobiota bacterium]
MFKIKFGKNKDKKTSQKTNNQRKHTRLDVLKHLEIKVYVRILPYYRTDEFEGELVNFSEGGIALRLPKMIAHKSYLYLQVTLPNRLCIACHGEVRHLRKISPHDYLIGIQFLDLPNEVKSLLRAISKDYQDCDNRIQNHVRSQCSTSCAAYSICSKHEKIY